VTAAPEALDIRKPLRIGDLLAAAVRIYGSRPVTFLATGLIQGLALVATVWLPFAADLIVVALSFGIAYAVVTRLVVGDPIEAACARTLELLPVVASLALLVGIPFSFAASFLVFLIVAAAWLGLSTFAIPVALVEAPDAPGYAGRMAHALRRTVELARVEYIHAFGVAAIMIVLTLLVGVILSLALFSFAENGRVAALAISQIVLSPFFFIGLSVLYFDQQARAEEKDSARR
jgi:hypothetical protein